MNETNSRSLNIVWLRRDLRIYDHAAFAMAMQQEGGFIPLFIFDKNILSRFKHKRDRRLSFILLALLDIHQHAKKRGSGLLVCFGDPEFIWKKIASEFKPAHVFADEDYEAETLKRDQSVKNILKPAILHLLKDHLIFAPNEIKNQSGLPFKVFTPYSKMWLANFTPSHMGEYALRDWDKLDPIAEKQQILKEAGVDVLDMESSPEQILAEMGYEYFDDPLWKPHLGLKRLDQFIDHILSNYKNTRDMVGIDGTSQISPYLRFGMVSIRDCVRRAYNAAGAEKWLSELIWREFYAMILFHAPESAHTEWNEKYREQLNWSTSETHFAAWCEGKTGYPIVDASMRQLVNTGWMHNRARMIVASFLTKDLQIDWRKGEEFFAQYLMDYELASNVGGWQWAASTGTDAQPYFRIFNPYLQSVKFDPHGDYIRRFVLELNTLDTKHIHEPHLYKHHLLYPKPIVDHGEARLLTLKMFKEIV